MIICIHHQIVTNRINIGCCDFGITDTVVTFFVFIICITVITFTNRTITKAIINILLLFIFGESQFHNDWNCHCSHHIISITIHATIRNIIISGNVSCVAFSIVDIAATITNISCIFFNFTITLGLPLSCCVSVFVALSLSLSFRQLETPVVYFVPHSYDGLFHCGRGYVHFHLHHVE